MAIARSVAYKVWISDIFSSEYIKQEGFNPNYVELDGNQVSRVNIIATVVGKFLSEDGNYGALTLDDGTETIRIKAFGPDVIKIKNVEMGQLVRAVGKIKEYNDERYLAPDLVRGGIDPNWIIVQKLELNDPKEAMPQPVEMGETSKKSEEVDGGTARHEPVKQEIIESEPVGETSTEEPKPEPAEEAPKESVEVAPNKSSTDQDLPNFIEIITKLDTGDGADMSVAISESKLDEEEAKNMIFSLLKDGEIYEPRKGKLKVL